MRGKPFDIALNGLVEIKRFHLIELSQVTIQRHPMATDKKNALLDTLYRNEGFFPTLLPYSTFHKDIN